MDAATLKAEGWWKLPAGGFSAAVGEVWIGGDQGQRVIGLIAGADLGNENLGIVHGGALLTFADIALGIAVAEALGAAHCATAQLQYQFVAAARAGNFITCEPEIVRKTSQMVFVRGLVKADGLTIGSAEAIFKVLNAEKMGAIRAG